MDLQSLIIFLAIGAVAGWLAGTLMKGAGFGLLGNIIVGIIGAVVGGFVFGLLGIWAAVVRRQHDQLLRESLSHTNREVQNQHAKPTDLSLDDQPDGEQKNHVANQVQPSGVQKIVGQPLQRMKAVTERQDVRQISGLRQRPSVRQRQGFRLCQCVRQR